MVAAGDTHYTMETNVSSGGHTHYTAEVWNQMVTPISVGSPK